MRNVIAALLLAFTAVTGSGCFYSHGQVDLLGSGDKFDGDYERFTRLVRWGHWEMATPLVLEHEQDAFIATMQQLGTVTNWRRVFAECVTRAQAAHAPRRSRR